MAEYYTDKQLPGVGISIGLTRLFSVLEAQGYLNDALVTAPADVLILPMTEADVAGLSPHRTGFQEVDFFRTPLKGVDFSDCALEGITVSESLGELRGMKINPAQAVDLIPLLGIQLL